MDISLGGVPDLPYLLMGGVPDLVHLMTGGVRKCESKTGYVPESELAFGWRPRVRFRLRIAQNPHKFHELSDRRLSVGQ